MTGPTPFDDRYDEPDQLRDQLRRLLRHRVLIALGILLGLLGGLALALQRANTYTATSEVLVRSTTDPFGAVGVSADNQVSMSTEQRIAASAAVAHGAARLLGRPDSQAGTLGARVRVTNPMKSQVLRFEFTAREADRAARGANAFAEAYLVDRKVRNDAAVQRATHALEQQMAVLNQRLAQDQLERAAAKPATQNQLYSLQKKVLDIRARDTDGGDIVRRAQAPALPVGPGPRTLLALGLVLGLLLGIVLAWVRSALDTRVRSVGEVRDALGAPVFGILPSDDGGDDALLTVGRTVSPRTEAYRALAFRLRQIGGAAGLGRMLVVAPRRADAAEDVAANLAAALTEEGGEVVLVDAAPDTSGLAAHLPLMPYEPSAGEDGFPAGVLVDADAAGSFAFTTTGRTGPYLRAAEAERTVSEADSSAIVVTGPFLGQADALAVAQRVDGVIVVADLNGTRRDDLRKMQELIGCSGGHILGAVLDTGRPRRRLRALFRRRKNGPTSPVDTATMDLPLLDGTLTVSRR
ncbi:hypothetical protein [Streptomyces sp. ALI-76-A]|uniref:hypothetical protein n=1 Tax=Streptomyces sp. ALI-76-A TaxID=3025736 RepID=UPI00256F53C5|nr:hypothetical protein [Streptomyces sp. ALI-76-A]MDL5205196.1 hypothetical protein [Streptomyces sp. ALI-76-A]